MGNFEGLDEIDNRILEMLRFDARKSFAEIGKELNIARQTVKNRVAAMEQRGIIRGYVTMIDTIADTETSLVFIDIDVNPEYFNDVIEYLQKDPAVQRMYQMTGTCHLHLISCFSSHRWLQNYVDRLRKKLMGVRYVTYSIAMSTLKDSGGVIHNEIQHKDSEHLENTGQS